MILWSTFLDGYMPMFVFLGLVLLVGWLCFKIPKRMFLVFVMLISLENVIITPSQFPIGLRPFQLIGAILAVSLIVTALFGSSSRKLLSFKDSCLLDRVLRRKKIANKVRSKSFGIPDRAIFVFPIFAFLAIMNAPDKLIASKLAVILVSFVILFWLCRNFLHSKKDIVEALLFFVFGSIPVILWSFYQAFAKLVGLSDFEVFTARVNGTFTEPDWLGVYLTLIIATLLWFRHLAKPDTSKLMICGFGISRIFSFFLSIYFIIAFAVLVLTVSRSAWLGVLAVYGVYLGMLIVDWLVHRSVSLGKIVKDFIVIGVLSSLAVLVVGVTGLSTFHFGNRAASSISGKQLITISCLKKIELPQEIRTMEELDIFGCAHIDLEQIDSEKAEGKIISTIFRPDPNVDIRKDIYKKTWSQIKKYPLLGQGLGSATSFLGTDNHGSGLNASNIVLEILLSMGIFAVIIAVSVVVFLLSWSIRRLFKFKEHVFSSLILLTTVAIIVPNMFNSGLLMGMFWFWLAMSVSIFRVVYLEKAKK